MKISVETWEKLKDAARAVSKNAYVRYSQFPVGAAVLTENGEIFAGCNVENASYGLTSCAERNAIFHAVAAGQQKIKAIVVYTPTINLTMPCGACRQVIREFGQDTEVLMIADTEKYVQLTINDLFPQSFGPEDL